MKASRRLKVLFLTRTSRREVPYMDPSSRYRCYNFAEELRLMGCFADVVSDHALGPGMVSLYDAFVFHRPAAADWAGKGELLSQIGAAGKPAVADFDDLTFAAADLALFSRFTVSTPALKESVAAMKPGADVVVTPNGLSRDIVALARAVKPVRGLPGGLKTISYMSGTATHEQDFAVARLALDAFLSRHSEYRLCIYGQLAAEREMKEQRAVVHLQQLGYRDFIRHLANATVNIAPLETGRAFNEAKSGLKFFESGAFGVPTVATPNSDLRRFDSAGLLFAETSEEWGDALERLATPDGYARATDGLAEYCLANCSAEASAVRLLEILEGVR